MQKSLITFLVAGLLSFPVMAQHGTAPNGYYPNNYTGAIFTGLLEATKGDAQEITLVYTKGTKTERFVGRLESTCNWKAKDGSARTFNPTDTWNNVILTAYYRTITKKSGGQKSKENLVFAIIFIEIDGKKVPEDKRLMISCSEEKSSRFMGF